MVRCLAVTTLAALSALGCSFLSDFDGLTTSRDGGACTSPFGQDASQWTLSFDDEFAGTELDRTVWNDHIWYEAPDATLNYAVEGGALKLWPDKGFVNRTIDTDGKWYQTYGYFEIEAKLPIGKGVRPLFWMLNHDDAKNRPDFSVLQAYPGGGPASGWGDAALHPVAYGVEVVPMGDGAEQQSKLIPTVDLSSAFHRYGAKWTETEVTFYLDGVETAKLAVALSVRMYLTLDLWFGSASGEPDASTPTGKGNAFEIRYVRVWKRGSGC